MTDHKREWVAELQFLDFDLADMIPGYAPVLRREWVAQITFIDLLENQLLEFLSSGLHFTAASPVTQTHVNVYYYDDDDALFDLAEWGDDS